MVVAGGLYYFVIVPLLGGSSSELSLSQVAGIIGTIGGSSLKMVAFGVVAFAGGKYLTAKEETTTLAKPNQTDQEKLMN